MTLRRLKDWQASRLERQIAFDAALNTLITAFILSAAIIAGAAWLVRSFHQDNLRTRIAGYEHTLSQQLDRTTAELAQLADNTLFANALVDSAGRSAYLTPFLRGFHMPGVAPGSLTLCDFIGRPIASAAPSPAEDCSPERSEFDAMFEGKQPTAFFKAESPIIEIVILHPILYPNTGQVEGVLSATILPEHFLDGLADLAPESRIRLTRSAGRHESANGLTLRLERPLDLHPPLRQSGLGVVVEERLPLGRIVAHSALPVIPLTLLLMLWAIWRAIRDSRRVTGPLKEITETARRITRDISAEVSFPQQRDEVGQLAHSMERMLRALRASKEDLERQVRERTAELEHNIKALMQTEQQLRQREQELHTAQAVAHIGSWKLDSPTGTLTWSAESYRIFGLAQGAPMDYTTFLEAVHPDDRDAIDHAWQQALKGAPYDIEHRVLAGSETRWVHEQAELHFDAKGQLHWAIGTLHEITDRKRAEMRLQESQALYESLVTALPQFIYRVDRTGRFTYVNNALLNNLGLPAEAVIGKNAYDFYPAALAEKYRKDDQRVLQSGEALSQVEENLNTVQGLKRVEVLKIPVRDASGAIQGIQGVSWDITKRHYARVMLEIQRDLAQALNARHSYQEIVGEILDGALRFPELDCGGAYQAFPEGGFSMNVHQGLSEDYVEAVRHLPAGSAEAAIIHQGRLLCHSQSPAECPNSPHFPLPSALQAEQLQAAVILPVLAGGRIALALALGARHSRSISRETLIALETLAVQFGNTLERIKNEEQLRLAATVFDHSHEGILITDPQGRILEANAAFSSITGYGHEEVLGKNPRILNSGLQDPAFYQDLWSELISTGQWQGELWDRRKSGEIFAELLNISAVRDKNGETSHYVAIFVDITLQKEHEKHLEQLAHYDPLTGLPNRVLLADRMNMALARARRHHRRLAVCFLDLDGFKQVNDRHGHDSGDRLLVEIAARLRECVREEDTVARLSGDEFMILLGGIGEDHEYEEALRRILDAISRPVEIHHATAQVSGSIGVALYPDHDDDPDRLLRAADQAMYAAKQGGKNRYQVFTQETAGVGSE